MIIRKLFGSGTPCPSASGYHTGEWDEEECKWIMPTVCVACGHVCECEDCEAVRRAMAFRAVQAQRVGALYEHDAELGW